MAPKDENELAAMVRTAVDHDGGPIAVRYPRGAGRGVRMDFDPQPIPIGKAERLRDGDDLSLIAVGSMVDTAFRAADALAAEGVSASVLNARFVKPLDGEAIVEEARRTGRVLTLEENVVSGGFGAAVLELLQAERVTGVTTAVAGLPDEFITHAPRERLLGRYGLTLDGVLARARELVSGERTGGLGR